MKLFNLNPSFSILRSFVLLWLSVGLLASCGDSTIDALQNAARSKQPVAENELSKNLTIFVHGFDKSGYKKSGVYGDEYSDPGIQQFLDLAMSQTANNNEVNLLRATTYYGDTAPDYYTDQDSEDIQAITEKWQGGIPRYALIVGKYIRHIMQEEQTDRVNIVSGSMGSLVTRWLIEKDIEGLASQQKIAKWYSLEGVITGNYAAGKKAIIKHFYGDIKSIDITHMSQQWIENNLHNPASEADSPFYKHILLAQQASTEDDLSNSALTRFLFLNGQFSANDGTQRVEETRFSRTTERARYHNQPPTFTLIHESHLSLVNNKGAWANVLTFLNDAKKRVKITLLNAQIDDLHEKIRWYNRKAEIIIGSRVYSPETELTWGITKAISERTIAGAAIPVHKYRRNGENKELNQPVLDQFVPSSETNLRVELTAEEVDYGPRYHVYELRNRHYSRIDSVMVDVPVEAGIYDYSSHEWSFRLQVEVIDY